MPADASHAYENGFYNLGRQTLLQPIEWLDDGWCRATHDVDRPIPKPVPSSTGTHGFAYSDDFSSDRMGVQWSFYKGSETDRERYRYEDNSFVLKAKVTRPADSSPLWFVTGDHAYEFEVAIDADPEATAGVLLFYNQRLYVGLGYSATNLIMPATALIVPPRSHRTSGARCTFACATTATSSPSTTVWTERPGSDTTGAWKSLVTTTMWGTTF